jgi:hypothetical protein
MSRGQELGRNRKIVTQKIQMGMSRNNMKKEERKNARAEFWKFLELIF